MPSELAIAELRETEVVQLTPLWGRLSLPSRWTVLKDLEYGREDLKLSAWKVYTVLRDEKTPSLAEEKGASGFNNFIKSVLKEPLGRYFCFVRDLIHPLGMGASFAIYGLSLFCAVLNEVLIPFFIFKSTGDGRILDQGVPTVHVVAYVIVTLTNVFVVSAMFSLLGVYIFALAQYDGLLKRFNAMSDRARAFNEWRWRAVGGCCGLRRSAQDEFAWRHATMAAHEDEENKKLWAQPRAEAALRSGNWQLQMADPATTEGWSLIRAYLARMIDKDMSLSAMLVTPFFLVGGGFLLAVAWDTWANGGLDRLLTMTAGRVTMLVYLVMMLGCMYAVAILDRLISGKFARQAIVVDEAIAQCKRRREHTNSSHTTKHAELSKAIALLKVTQSECKFNAARKSAASVFLRLQWVGVALSGVAGIMRIHNSMH